MTRKPTRPPFDYTAALREVCRDICAKTPGFRKYDLSRIGFAIRRSRGNDEYGVFASLTPLRFENGSKTTVKRGAHWTIRDVCDFDTKTNLLYILTVYVPRFINMRSVKEKIDTLTHELYHIGPNFDGDVRRFEGRNFAHGSSRKKYDLIVSKIADEWLATDPSPEIWAFLRWNAAELEERYGRVVGWSFPAVPLKKISPEEARKIIDAEKAKSRSDEPNASRK